jgi:hypothetical protein
VYEKSPKAGIASVTIDGVAQPNVDQYAATVQFKQSTTFSNLSAGAHTVVIKSTGTRNANSTGTFLYHDAFYTTTDSADLTPDSENNYDGSTTYTWERVNFASASGGSFSDSASPSSALAFTFSGTSITWKYLKSPKGGIANVWIDGVPQTNVDQYGSSVSLASTTYSGLANALHTIFIKPSGTRNASSSGVFLYHDAFVVGSTTFEN